MEQEKFPSAKKILIIGPAWPYRGGLAAFNERMARALVDAGYEVDVLTFSLQYPDFLFPGKSQFADTPAPEGLRVVRGINSVNPLNWLWQGWRLRRSHYAVIITAYWLPFMGPALGTILRLAGARDGKKIDSESASEKGIINRFILSVLALFRLPENAESAPVKLPRHRRIGLIHNFIPHEKRLGDALFSRYFAGANDAFLCLSEAVAQQVRQVSKATVAWHPHPIYDHYGQPIDKQAACDALGLDGQNRYLLFFGFIRKYKGLDILLEALANTPEDIHLLVAGEFYEDDAPYLALIQEKKLEERVHLFSHFIPDDEVHRYFSAADLVVQPYRNATQSGISQMAYHFDKPMVVTQVGGLPEIVPHRVAGLVAEPNAASIAAAVETFYRENMAESLTKGVQQEKQRFLWPHFVQVLEKLFR